MSKKIEPVILVHGGAGDIPDSRVSGKLDGVRIAARLGYKKFLESGSMLEGCIKAVTIMEDDENFNAGRGSVLTEDGVIEMEALIMEGDKLKAGSVTCLRNVARPIEVARLVMEKTPHVIIGGKSAKLFATRHGIPSAEDSYLYTRAAKEALEHYHYECEEPTRTEIGAPSVDREEPSGSTVGAIGIDSNGHVVSCTSTGGITGKMTGRIGDTPVPGCGGYADDNVGAVSATGNGDAILRYALSSRILNLMELCDKALFKVTKALLCGVDAFLQTKKTAKEATEEAVNGLTARTAKTAGAITLSKTGDIGIGFTSKRMAWAYLKGDKVYFGIEKDDDCEEDV